MSVAPAPLVRRRSVLLLLIALAVSCTAGVTAASSQDAGLDLFDRYLDALRQQARIPGLSAAVVRDRAVWFRAYGLQDIDGHIAANPDTPYEIASLTKTFTSTLLMQCVERGTLSLDDPIRRYTTAIAEAGATVRHVLTHTSQGTPGVAYQYDGNRFAALTSVVDGCQGRPFRRALASAILDPAAMADSVPGHDLDRPAPSLAALFDAPTLGRYASVLSRLALPYLPDSRGRPVRAEYPLRDISASAGLLSTVVDLAKYDQAIDAHLFIGGDTQELAWTNAVSTTGQRLPYALGWFVQRYNSNRVVWHYGYWPQFSALYLKLPERRLTLILLANSGGLSAAFPLADGDVTVSPFARAFLRLLVP